MRTRYDVVFISSVLFTVALVYLIPSGWGAAMTGRNKSALVTVDAGFQAAAQAIADFGVAALTIIAVGLLVTWTGYIQRVRWSWFVMFLIVWMWAFPLLVLPLFQHTIALTLPEWLSKAWHEPGPARMWAENLVTFALMLVALILPVKPFFLTNRFRGWNGMKRC